VAGGGIAVAVPLADEVAVDDGKLNLSGGRARCVFASVAVFELAVGGATVTVARVAIVTGFGLEALPIATNGFANAVFAAWLRAALVTAVERSPVAVFTLFAALDLGITAHRLV